MSARRLLESSNIGRLAYCADSGPRIVPMSCTLVSEQLIFRTGMDTEASGYLINRPVAFDVDQVDEFLHTGWSVLIVGNAGLMVKRHCVFLIFSSRAALARRQKHAAADTGGGVRGCAAPASWATVFRGPLSLLQRRRR
jgi:Pyridoxamine 5'-phosphate oxidase